MALDKLVDGAKLDADLTAIADAIRSKNGSSGKLPFPQGYVDAVRQISGSSTIAHAGIPKYVKDAVIEVAEKVKAVQTPESIVFMAMSDQHHPGQQETGWQENINTGNLHAAMAAKALAYSLQLDFMACLGDFTFGNGTTTKPMLISQIEEINRQIGDSGMGIPQFRTVGNHDTGEYRYKTTSDLSDLTGTAELTRLIGSYCEGAVYGSQEFGYCYRDFPKKKLRVICLNSCEGETESGEKATYSFSEAQLLWFAQTLYSLNDKPNAADWNILTLAHYPLDYGDASVSSAVLKAYIKGESITKNGVNVNFSGHNQAKFVAHFHGHTHCFKTAKLHEIVNGKGVEYDAWRVATPNACFYRENEYHGHPIYGIDFGEEISYPKTAGTKDDTAFTVNVIDPRRQVIHSFCYGAGYDRVIGYASTVFCSINTQLTHCSLSNTATSIEKGQSYTSNVTVEDKYHIKSVSVIMGGVDISTTAYADGVITIPKVTGNIVIRAVAEKPVHYTNLVPAATDESGGIYNGTGYKDATYLSSSGTEGSKVDFTTTGFIPVSTIPYTIRVAGTATGDFKEYGWRIVFYDKSHAKLAVCNGNMVGTSVYWGEVVKEPDTALTWTITPDTNACGNIENAAFMRISCRTNDQGSGLVVTINEPIE